MTKIGDRMKENYENRDRHMLTRRMPVIVRVDGRAFHTYTRGFNRPFDMRFVGAMVYAAKAVCEDAQGCKAAYIQSDEASFLLTDYDTLATEAWFGYAKSKVETISASVMTAAFNARIQSLAGHALGPAHFDARAFNIPREEVANYFLWRAMDWERNSVSMYCRSFYSDKQMRGKGRADQHEMLYQAGKNWTTDLDAQLRNGTWLVRQQSEWVVAHTPPKYASIAEITDGLTWIDAIEIRGDDK
jgi:tRNA(His) guanylyltransferase